MSALPHEPAGAEPSSLAGQARSRADLADRLALLLHEYHDLGKRSAAFEEALERGDASAGGTARNVRSLGRARKVSVSMPEELTAAVQRRVGRGEFSQYVTDAVARQLELDLLAELAELLEAEHGPVPEDILAEAGAAWPDAE